MGFMVDTTSYLNDIDWAAFYAWKPQYPGAAGRYFGGGYTWSGSEFTDARASTGGVLTRVAPIRACQPSRQETAGSTGYGYGQADAQDTMTRIGNAITAGQLSVPSGGGAIVWLDVEANVGLTPAYWAGFANELNLTFDYAAGIYTQFVNNGSGVYYPQASVQAALNASYNDWSNADSLCAGLWTSEPEPCSGCAPDGAPEWSVLGTYTQPYQGSNYPITNYIFQYAEYGGCTTTCGVSNFAGGQNLDMDGTDSTGAEGRMLLIA